MQPSFTIFTMSCALVLWLNFGSASSFHTTGSLYRVVNDAGYVDVTSRTRHHTGTAGSRLECTVMCQASVDGCLAVNVVPSVRDDDLVTCYFSQSVVATAVLNSAQTTTDNGEATPHSSVYVYSATAAVTSLTDEPFDQEVNNVLSPQSPEQVSHRYRFIL